MYPFTDALRASARISLLSVAIFHALLTGCGAGTVGIVSSSRRSVDGVEPTNAKPVGSALDAPRSISNFATISFRLIDEEEDATDVHLFFDVGSGLQPITLSPDSRDLTAIASSGDSPIEVEWDYKTDLGGEGFFDNIALQLEVVDGLSPPLLTGVVQGNGAPVVGALAPSPGGLTEYTGNLDFEFNLSDAGADAIQVRVEFNADTAGDYPDESWVLARPAGTPGADTTPEFVTPTPRPSVEGRFGFQWDTSFDVSTVDGIVRVRVTPMDALSAVGSSAQVELRVDNNAPPTAVLRELGFFLGAKERGIIPVPIKLFDAESDALTIIVQWRGEGDVFPNLDMSVDQLRDLMTDPARAREREALQIAVEAPLAFEGRIAALSSASANELSLPELGAGAAGLLAHEVRGRTLEVLRPSLVPVPMNWSLASLDEPVATRVTRQGRAALVLDRGPTGWRLREIALDSGAELAVLATGSGEPRALAIDRAGEILFVATSDSVHRFDRFTGELLGSVLHTFTSGPRGLAAAGSSTLIATGDSDLVSLDFDSLGAATIVTGLNEPWGIVADPLAEGSFYVAERGSDRVLVVDLDDLVPREVPALPAPETSESGASALSMPTALALERGGARLLVLCEDDGIHSLRRLDLRSPYDLNSDGEGADPYVRTITELADAAGANLSTGPDQLRVVSLPALDTLALGGGQERWLEIVNDPALAYDATRRVVRLTEDVISSELVGRPWRIPVPFRPVGSPAGETFVFAWDSTAVPDRGKVQLHIVPIDEDRGTSSGDDTGFKPYRTSFDRVLTLLTGDSPEALIAVDLDADGDLDLVSANARDDNLSVILQTGPSVFSIPVLITTDEEPVALAAADINADGRVDLVCGHRESHKLTVFTQDPSGGFSSSFEMDTGGRLLSVLTTDIDRDGRVDIVAANSSDNEIWLFMQDANGDFPDPGKLPGEDPTSVAAADLNGDGRIDLVSANGTGKLELFWQQEAGEFLADPVTLMTGSIPQQVVVADLDGDGDQDLITPNFSSGDVSIFYQLAPGSFDLAVDISVGLRPISVAAGDADGDGDLDLVCALEGARALAVLYQTAPGTFSLSPTLLPAGSQPQAVVAADLDGDGDLDFCSSNADNDDNITVILQTSQADFGSSWTSLPTDENPLSLVAVDLDADGDLDLVSSNTVGDNLSLHFQTAPGVFSPAEEPLGGGNRPETVVAADFNADGRVDLACAYTAEDRVELFYQQAQGGFEADPTLLRTVAETLPSFLVAADLNNDGRADLATANTSGEPKSLTLFLQEAGGGFPVDGTPLWLDGPFRPVSLVAADLNGDGLMDLATARPSSDSVTILIQASAGTFNESSVELSVNASPSFLAAADLNSDGLVDLMTANQGSGDLSILHQQAGGGFLVEAATLSLSFSPVSIALADLDGDRDLDVIAVGAADGEITFFEQIALGEFVARSLVDSVGAAFVVAADLDGDGDVDLAQTNSSSNQMTLYWNGD
ncbi:MAG: hypothetical protein ACI841_001149 [Planctomycetota bacterium]|jgi:hypothetical protein